MDQELEAVERICRYLDRVDPGGVVGVYLYGSAVTSGLRPGSDVDLLVAVRRSLREGERVGLTEMLLGVSGWAGHRVRFPEVVGRRPVELTCVVVDDDRKWLWEGRFDYQFGEWLRSAIVDGLVLRPGRSADVVTLVATALAGHRVLRGRALGAVLGEVPPDRLRDAVVASVPEVLDGVDGDERNALLTLARMVVTVETGAIVSKDRAAELVAPTLDERGRWLLERARVGYLERAEEEWSEWADGVRMLADELAAGVRRERRGDAPDSR